MSPEGGSTDCHENAEQAAVALRMVFDRLNIVPAFQYKFSTVISPWELHCFYLAAAKYQQLMSQPGQMVVQNGAAACETIEQLLEDYSTGWRIAGELWDQDRDIPLGQC